MKFRFDCPHEDAVYVKPDTLYGNADAWFGFLTDENRQSNEHLQITELNDGFEPAQWCRGKSLAPVLASEHGAYVDWAGEGELPLTFAADVPCEGNYKVDVALYAEHETDVLLFLGRRRLAWRGKISGEWTGSFLANICPIIPRTFDEPMEDLTLDVTVIGRGVCLTAVDFSEWEGRTVYIAGDSTVADQSAQYPYFSGNSYCGWGQMLSAFAGLSAAVSNHAHSGLTTESFRSEGHYNIMYERIKPGDVCLFQFAHNDQKLAHLAAEGGYRENLIRYIEEIRQKGAEPILVTPLARNTWKGSDQSYNDLLAPFAKECKRLAGEYNVRLIDLHGMSKSFILEYGRENAKRYLYPDDYTHTNDYGAYKFAGFICGELFKAGIVADCKDKSVWEPPETFEKPEIPGEYARMQDNGTRESLFKSVERPEDALTRIEALEMVSKAFNFFSTNVYNDAFKDVIGHETYAGIVECGLQNGIIPEEIVAEGSFYPQRSITGAELYQFIKNGYTGRRTWTKRCEEAFPRELAAQDTLARGAAAQILDELLDY